MGRFVNFFVSSIMNKDQKEYSFKYSKNIFTLDSLSVLIPLLLASYLYFVMENKIIAIILLIVGVANSVYFISRFANNKIQLRINSAGILIEGKLVKWQQIEEIEIENVSTGSSPSEFLTVLTKSMNDHSVEITELNIDAKKLKTIINQFGSFIK